jgi:hypothetical protein
VFPDTREIDKILIDLTYGTIALYGLPFQVVQLSIKIYDSIPYPSNCFKVWAVSVSLAATKEITVVFSSSSY